MSVRALPNLQGPRVRLRGPLQCDASQLSSLSVDPEIQRGYGVALDAPRQRTREEANGRVQWMMAERCLWVIEHRGAYAGNIELHSHNTQDRRASLALGLADGRLLGQGLGTEAMTCVLGHAFGAPSLGGMDCTGLQSGWLRSVPAPSAPTRNAASFGRVSNAKLYILKGLGTMTL